MYRYAIRVILRQLQRDFQSGICARALSDRRGIELDQGRAIHRD